MNNQPLPKPKSINNQGNPSVDKNNASSNLGTASKPANIPTNLGNIPKPNPQGLSANKAQSNLPPAPGKMPPAPSSLPPTSGKTSLATPTTPTSQDKPTNSTARVPLSQKPAPAQQPASAQQPTSAQQPAPNNIKVQFPPTSLSALSSMSSNTIPANNDPMQERTVLGAPIPQAIRGEKVPVGLSVAPPTFKQELQPPVTISSSQTTSPGKTAPVPVAPSRVNNNSQSSTNQSDNSDKPVMAKNTSSIARFIPLVIGIIALIAVVVFAAVSFLGGSKTNPLPNDPNSGRATNVIPNSGGNENNGGRVAVPAEQKTITYWGLWEPDEVVAEIISDFEAANPGVKVEYLKQSHKDYRERLQTALNSGSGPDIFRFHASWAPMFKNNLYPIPSSVVSSAEFKENYYPVVNDQLVINGQHVGVPLMYDGLALYYNEEIFESANVSPPSTWAELRLLASKLTVKSATGIERAGLAIGNTSNVEHFSDILAVLMLQNGANFNEPNSQEAKDALLFYTNFVLKDKVWDESMPSSTVAFARGDVAMMFAPSWRAHEINQQNPDLRYKTMTLPQLSDERITWGSYWAEGINSSSKYKDESASFLAFISSDENLKKLFSKASETRAFGEIYPKVSMAGELINDKVIAAYLDDAAYSRSWYLNSFTHDNGINDQLIEYYKDGINAILNGDKIEDVLETIDAGTKDVLKQYGVTGK